MYWNCWEKLFLVTLHFEGINNFTWMRVFLWWLIIYVSSAVNGNYTDWSEWRSCSTTCGVGVKARNRTCTNPMPQFGGKSCEEQGLGLPNEAKHCYMRQCGGWYKLNNSEKCIVFFNFFLSTLEQFPLGVTYLVANHCERHLQKEPMRERRLSALRAGKRDLLNLQWHLLYFLLVEKEARFVFRSAYNATPSWELKVIVDCFVVALLRSVIDPEKLCNFSQPSDSKLKPIATWALAFSCALGNLPLTSH